MKKRVISFLRDIERQRDLEQEGKKRYRSTVKREADGVLGNAAKQNVEMDA